MIKLRNGPEHQHPRLDRVAAAASGRSGGAGYGAYVTQLVERAADKRSLDEVLEPLRAKFAASGVSDDELVQDITDAQADYRAAKHKKSA